MNRVSKQINALFVLPSLARAGAEIQLVNLINGLDSNCYSKHLVTFGSRLDQRDRLDASIKHTHSSRKYKLDFSIVPRIASLIDEKEIDVVHCTLQFALLMGWLGTHKARRKPHLSVAIHTTKNRDLKGELQDRMLYQWLMRSCSRIIFVCETQRQHWERKFPFVSSRSRVVYNGIDTNYFDPSVFVADRQRLRDNHGLPRDSLVACCIARFLPEKGHRLLIEALPTILGCQPQAHFLFAGDGPLKAKMENAICRMGLESNVHFLGSLDDIRPVLAMSDLTIMPSITETFSMTMLESMAMCVPIVATNVGGTGEAVKPGRTGFLVEPENPDALAAGVLQAFDSLMAGSRELGQNGRALIEQNFTIQSMITATSAVLAELVSTGSTVRQ